MRRMDHQYPKIRILSVDLDEECISIRRGSHRNDFVWTLVMLIYLNTSVRVEILPVMCDSSVIQPRRRLLPSSIRQMKSGGLVAIPSARAMISCLDRLPLQLTNMIPCCMYT